MSSSHPTPEQILDWWEHRLADLRDSIAVARSEIAEAKDAAPDWHQVMADRLMRLRNDSAEVERVLGEWRKLA